MPESAPKARIVLTTANPDQAASLAKTLVEERLAACANIIPSVQSIYRWSDNGQHAQAPVESSTETLILLKTTSDHLAALEQRLHQLHSYQTPEFLVLDIESGSHQYLDWLTAALGRP